jgi:hypothetical protein
MLDVKFFGGTMCLRLLLTAWIATASLYLSGCATILYVGAATGFRAEQIQRNDAGKPLIRQLKVDAQTDKAYVVATKVIEFKTGTGFFAELFFELTPLGIMGPLVGYPQKSYRFTGTFNIHTDPPEAESRIHGASFIVEGEKGSTEVLLDFTKGVEDTLKTTGRSIEYSPESIEVTVTCADTACQVTSKPDVISSDGLVRLESREVLNQARLQEIAEAEAAAKRKQEAEVSSKPAVDKRSYRSVVGRPPNNSTLACDNPIVLQAALEYKRVGDYAHYDELLGGYAGTYRRCKIVPGGSVVFATSIGQGGYRQVRMRDAATWPPGFAPVVQLWMREKDLVQCADDGNPNECRPAKERNK